MTWLTLALLVAFFNALMDFFIKLSLVLKEAISLRWAVGFVLSLIGLYLLATK